MKTFKVRISPNKQQIDMFETQCRLTRWLYNDVLELFKKGARTPFSHLQSKVEVQSWSHFSLGKIVSPMRKKVKNMKN